MSNVLFVIGASLVYFVLFSLSIYAGLAMFGLHLIAVAHAADKRKKQ